MNPGTQKNSIIFIIGIGFIAAGVAQWSIAYQELNMLVSSFLIRWSVASLVAGLAGGLLTRKPPVKVALFAATGSVGAIFSRALYDMLLMDPASHNLIPFEIILGFVMAFPAGLLGAGIAYRINQTR